MSPHTNSFFSNTTGYSTEVSLIDDLVREQIKMFGVDVLYMPRRMLNLDKLLHESSKNAFELALPMPAYIKSFDGYDSGLEALTKFGVRSSDELTLQISKSEFLAYYAPFLKSYYNQLAGRDETEPLDRLEGETAARAKEGDLIYFPFDDSIFEIKYVQFDVPFFQLGKNYIFELQCEKFEYSGDTFDTGYENVDDTMAEPDYYRLEFHLDPNTGTGTFESTEEVVIIGLGEYDIIDGGVAIVNFFSELGNLDAEGEEQILTLDAGDANDLLYLHPTEDFRLYKDPGYVHRVPEVRGTVMLWDKPKGMLTVADLTDLDPEQPDLYKDLNVNKFDKVVIIGQRTGAVWYSEKAHTQPKAFDDGELIQKEFDAIKIIDDPEDLNPFGFV